jgi:hypothetical protein
MIQLALDYSRDMPEVELLWSIHIDQIMKLFEKALLILKRRRKGSLQRRIILESSSQDSKDRIESSNNMFLQLGNIIF